MKSIFTPAESIHPGIVWLAMLVFITGCWSLAGVRSVVGQDNGAINEAYLETLEDARVLLRSRDFQRAIPDLREGLQLAISNRDTEWEARFHFQLGVALQQRSLVVESNEDLLDAAGHYESYLRLRPRTGSALNNLAQIYTRTGKEGEASRLFARAVALEDTMRGFYAFNYAEFLKKQEVWGESAEYYRIALDNHPDYPEARQGLLEVYQKIDQSRLIAFIWDQIDEGRDVWATTSALQALSNLSAEASSNKVREEKYELLACIVVGMSRARYGPASSAKSFGTEADVFKTLRSLKEDSDIGSGISEILDIYNEPSSPSTAANSWWADKGDRFADPKAGWWPRDGFRMLLRTLGSWYERRENTEMARAYYMHTIALTNNTDKEPDLQAIVMLSDLLIAEGQTAEVEKLLQNTSTDLFYGKGQAYKKSNFKKIYTFHRTLGIMYALTKEWGDEHTIDSAIFQLEHALETRDIYNKSIARRKKLDPIGIEARLVNLLAAAYKATYKTKEAAELQLNYLSMAVKQEDGFAAREILRELDRSALQGRDVRRYDKLRKSTAGL